MRVQSSAVPSCGQSACNYFPFACRFSLTAFPQSVICCARTKNGSAGCSTHLAEPNPQSEVSHDGSYRESSTPQDTYLCLSCPLEREVPPAQGCGICRTPEGQAHPVKVCGESLLLLLPVLRAARGRQDFDGASDGRGDGCRVPSSRLAAVQPGKLGASLPLVSVHSPRRGIPFRSD